MLLNVRDNLDKVKTTLNSINFQNSYSFFNSWGWLETWIHMLPQHVDLKLFVLFKQNKPYLAFLVNKRRVHRYFFIKSLSYYINTSGIDMYDLPLWIEYNSIRCSSKKLCTLEEIVNSLPQDCDELILPALGSNLFPGNTVDNHLSTYHPYQLNDKYNIIITRRNPSYFIDLDEVRNKNYEYLSLISSNIRYQIRRSYKILQHTGKIKVKESSNLEEALKFFNEMISLHEESYTKKKRKSNFLTSFSIMFHENLIKNRYSQNEIQLLKVKIDQKTIGILYYFIDGDYVYYYQSGIIHHTDPKVKIGLICHTEAIIYNARKGFKHYDFLAGNEVYKRGLSNNKNEMIWLKIQKKKLLFNLENKLKYLIRHVRKKR